MRSWPLLGVISLSLYACASDVDQPGAGSAGLSAVPLPCDVKEVLEANCERCHGRSPLYGAPMALESWGDVQAPSKSDRTKKVWQQMGTRIHSAGAPMPPTRPLPAADRAILDAWLEAGAPAGDGKCGVDAGTPASALEPSSQLPCPESERSIFRAHRAGSDAPFEVAEDAGNLVMCFTFPAPWIAGSQAVAFQPMIDDARVVHHWILFETATPQPDNGAGPCNMPLDARFLQGWAPGNTGIDLPPDVGLRLPEKGKWLILQLHYWNSAGYRDVHDRSGVAMCTTSTPRPHTAMVSTLGSAAIDLPPRSSGVAVTGTCTPQIAEPIHVIGAAPHMHQLGRSFTTEILRGGNEAERTSLVDVANWDFNQQLTHTTDIVVNPGDKLKTTCRFDNPSGRRVTFGPRTEDEMCFNFVVTYPAPGLVNAGGANANSCID